MGATNRGRAARIFVVLGVLGLVALAAGPPAIRAYFEWRSSNPVRRGLRLSEQLGCFSCHGDLGRDGLPAPRSGTAGVPAWDGGEWMMHVRDESDLRRIVLEGSRPEDGGLAMPAYRERLTDRDLDDLVAAFFVASGMRVPPAGAPSAHGREVAIERGCFACHGLAGSGGLPNPGSLAGFIPGWYGSDFIDLVHDRGEFDVWIRQGGLPRLREHPVARRFLATQRVQMPSYPELSNADLDALWAYVAWLAQTDGGFRGSLGPVVIPRRFASVALVTILAALIAVYFRTTGYPFLALDDDLYVSRNPVVRAGWTLAGVRWAWTTGHASNWHPLTWLSHLLDSEIHGTWAGGHHATNVALHAINALLLFALLRAATGATWRALTVAALFALHPLRVESVAWVAERKDLLSTLFGLVATWGWVTWTRRDGVLRYLLACLAFAASLLSKPMLVTLPFVFLLLDVWPLGRGRRVVEKLPFFALAAASSVVTVLVQRSGAASGLAELPLALRLANACVSYVRYLAKIVWPVNLSPFYPFPGRESEPWSAAAVGGAVVLLVAITALVIRSGRPYAVFGWSFFLGTLVPVIGLVQVGMQAMADRYTYVPAIGIFVIAAWAAAELRPRVAVPAVLTAIVVCCGVTWVQVGYWKDSITLFRHGLAVAPGASTLHNNLGVALTAERRFEEAVVEFRRVTEIAPREPDGHFNLGLALARTGDTAGAIRALEEARRLRPDLPEIDFQLGMILRDAGRTADAARSFEAAIRARPDWLAAVDALAWILATDPDPRVRRPERALVLAERAARLTQARSAEILDTLAAAQAATGRFDAAVATLERALALSPAGKDPRRDARLSLYRDGRAFIATAPR